MIPRFKKSVDMHSIDNRSPIPTHRNPTRSVKIGSITIGAGHAIAVQSMCATKTTDVKATVEQIERFVDAGAGLVRLAVDSANDAKALPRIREATRVNLSVDLQENYRIAEVVAPWVDKIRYNPGHLYHFQPETPWEDKVRYLADTAAEADCAIRIGVNCGSVDPAKREKFPSDDHISPMVESAVEHAELLDQIGFTRYCVSLKDSHPELVVEANRRFAAERPDVPLHLGVTEAGMPPEGVLKTQIALQELLREGIGDTLRVSLTLPNARKYEEIEAGYRILKDVAEGRWIDSRLLEDLRLNIISCPSCSRVQNEAFVDLAFQVKEATRYAKDYPLTIAVMGCRVNGPGETDDADLGLWCGPGRVNLKCRGELVGAFGYDEIIGRLIKELNRLIEEG
jgi:(E)-4-hydroxy-3-methylbut-2-enyl-diphosphate synthase